MEATSESGLHQTRRFTLAKTVVESANPGYTNFTLSSFRIIGEMDSRLRGNDSAYGHRHPCHSREGGNPYCPIYRNMTK